MLLFHRLDAECVGDAAIARRRQEPASTALPGCPADSDKTPFGKDSGRYRTWQWVAVARSPAAPAHQSTRRLIGTLLFLRQSVEPDGWQRPTEQHHLAWWWLQTLVDAVTGMDASLTGPSSRCEGRLVAGVEMKAYVAGESPKTMTVETSDGKGPWRLVASLSADAAWGEDVPWARVSEPDPP